MEVKIPLYNLLNMVLTGAIFVAGLALNYPDFVLKYITCDIVKSLCDISSVAVLVCFFALIYEMGFIINRLGSVIGSIFQEIKLIKYNKDYVKYNKKKAIYPIMDTLSREFALSRTSFTLFAIISIMSLFRGNCCASLLFALISLIYLFSWSKQASKIVLLMADEVDNGINEKKVD